MNTGERNQNILHMPANNPPKSAKFSLKFLYWFSITVSKKLKFTPISRSFVGSYCHVR